MALYCCHFIIVRAVVRKSQKFCGCCCPACLRSGGMPPPAHKSMRALSAVTHILFYPSNKLHHDSQVVLRFEYEGTATLQPTGNEPQL
jgi:hypothetical protein